MTATIPLGSTTTTVDVPVRSDVVYEHDDAFTLELSAPDNLTISDGSAAGTIVNDEAVPSLTVADLAVIEKDTGQASSAAVQATLSGTLGLHDDRDLVHEPRYRHRERLHPEVGDGVVRAGRGPAEPGGADHR